jgi:hypothetical protein
LLDLPALVAAAKSSAAPSSTRRSGEGDAAGKRNNRNSGDTTAVGKRSSGTHGDTMTAQDTLRESRDKQPLTTVEELWDLLKETSMAQRNIELDTFVDFFDTVRVLDVSRALAKAVPYHDAARAYAVDMTKGRMRLLCGLLVQNADLSLLEVHMVLDGVDENSFGDVEDGLSQVMMSYKTFRKLFEILPALMCLQQEFIIALLAWEMSGRLELPEPIIVKMMATFGRKGKQTKAEVPRSIRRMDTEASVERQWSIMNEDDDDSGAEEEQKQQELNRQLVYRVLTLGDFIVFCRCGQIIDPTSKTCARSQDIESVYLRAHRKITELLEAHAKKRHRPAPKASARHEQGLVGRNEIEVLLSEVWALKPLASTYANPLDLIAQMLDRATKESTERSGGSSTVTSLAHGA